MQDNEMHLYTVTFTRWGEFPPVKREVNFFSTQEGFPAAVRKAVREQLGGSIADYVETGIRTAA